MSITHTLSNIADAGAQRYGLMIDGWKTLYGRALDAADFGTPRQLGQVITDAYTMAGRFAGSETSYITDAFEVVANEALTATQSELGVSVADDLPDELREHVSDFIEHLETEIAIQIERDIASLRKTLLDTYLTVTIASRAQRLPLRTALIQHRIASNSDVQFTFRDRRNAKWPTKRYVRTIWRHNLLSLYNDAVLMTLADHGIETAFIRHDDTSSALHGTEIAIVANTGLPTYADLRGETFHPNANAVVARYP